MSNFSKTPNIANLFGESLVGRRLAVLYQAGMQVPIEIPLQDTEGQPIQIPDQHSVHYRIYESLVPNIILDDQQATVQNGIATFTPTPDAVDYAGIYTIELSIVNTDQKPVWVREYWLYNEPTTYAVNAAAALPKIDRIRLLIRDSTAAENEILGTHQFSIEEIAEAAVSAVRFFNETPPIIASYNTRNFPFQKLWLSGILAYLYDTAVKWHAKVSLPYSAGGVQSDELNRTQVFAAFAQQKMQEFYRDVMIHKTRLHLASGWARIG